MAHILGKTEFWMGRFDTPNFLVAEETQLVVNNCARTLGVSVVGYTQTNSLTVLHWPETRAGYQAPTVEDCDTAIKALRNRLGGGLIRGIGLAPGRLHVMMGLRIGGYDGAEFERVDGVARRLPQDMSVRRAHMVSARYKTDGAIEPYDEPAAIITGSATARAAIHELAHQLRQHHYVIESADEPTSLYATSHGFRR
ncbi:MAG: hypothetical protein WBP26_01505 [Candidatus Saccharimonadales bacterium]